MFKNFLVAFLVFSACSLIHMVPASAEDIWFYTDDNGSQYYYREKIGARSWIGGLVIKVDANERSMALRYRFEYYDKIPYHIEYSDTFREIERGYLYGQGIPNPSAKILYEKYLRKR